MTHAGYFEGIGGFSLAAEWLGLQTVYTCELDEFRHEWLKTRFKHATHERDIRQTDGCHADIFTAGFPCQDISRANPKGKGINGERSGLWNEMYRIATVRRPNYLLLENSPQLVHRGLSAILGQLAAIGYDAEWNILSKHTLGFADIRKRLFVVAYPLQIGRNKAKVFNRKSYENGKKALKQRIQMVNQPDRVHCLEIRNIPFGELLQGDAGLSPEMVKAEIAAYGDAVCPHVAYVALHMILQHANNTTP